jgi:hypothetical protein
VSIGLKGKSLRGIAITMRLYREGGIASRNNAIKQWNVKPVGHSGCELRLAVSLLV